jgi:integrase
LAEVEGRITTLRAKQRGEGHDLTQRDARALAGEWYKWFVGQHEENPGEPSRWDGLRKALWHLLECLAGDDETDEIDMRAPEAREEIHPRLADEAKTAQFLACKGEVLTPAAMTLFLDAVIHEFLTATRRLKRLAAGDYSADQHLLTLPDYRRKAKPVACGAGKTCVQLFRAYVDAVKPSRSTITRWRCVFPALDKHLDGLNIDAFTADEARRWARSLVTDKRSAYTVKNTWVSASCAVFGWALEEKLVSSNPFADVPMRVPKKVINREDGKAFSHKEQQVILKAALAIKDTKSPIKAACRWAPWLCAYSGARAGEITQLRGQDIEQRDGFVVLKIKPEAGDVKGSKARTVPIHEHVIAQGFLDYVASKGKGPLFYNPAPKDGSGDTDIMKPKRPRYEVTRNRLAEWVRALGVTDKEIRPNHAWRHTFRTRASRAGIEKRIRDEICGHAPGTVADGYEHPTVEDMAVQLKRFPRYELE